MAEPHALTSQGILFFFSVIVGFIYDSIAEQLGWTVCIVCFLVFVDISSMAPLLLTFPEVVTRSDLGTEEKKSGDRKIKRHAKNN
uniref:Uncharacterized protein n=1 Tax=Mus spicilegus TaxID=10103 RepID=A0A8C6IMM9_MUSSI